MGIITTNIMDAVSAAACSLKEATEEFDCLIPDGSSVLLAVSGGSDSMGLLCIAASEKRRKRLSVSVVFIDHGLREGVDEEWQLVQEYSEKLDIPAYRENICSESVKCAHGKGSMQQWARDERYGLIAKKASFLCSQYVLTAHTMDDQAETVLLRLLRGTGLDGLSGIPHFRQLGDVMLARPLLTVTKAQIREMLTSIGMPWIEDPSNQNDKFKRVAVRQQLLPLLEQLQPGIVGRLFNLSKEIRGIGRFLDSAIEDPNKLVHLRLAGGCKIESATFEALPAEMWGRLIRFVLKTIRGDLRRLSRRHINPIEKCILEKRSTDKIQLPQGAVVYCYGGALYVFPHELFERPTGAGQPVSDGPGRWRVKYAALRVLAEIKIEDDFKGLNGSSVQDLQIRARKEGDRLWQSGKKLKTVLSEGKIPRPYRDSVPVLALDGQVIACPAIIKSRCAGLNIKWLFDEGAPFLDIDFPL